MGKEHGRKWGRKKTKTLSSPLFLCVTFYAHKHTKISIMLFEFTQKMYAFFFRCCLKNFFVGFDHHLIFALFAQEECQYYACWDRIYTWRVFKIKIILLAFEHAASNMVMCGQYFDGQLMFCFLDLGQNYVWNYVKQSVNDEIWKENSINSVCHFLCWICARIRLTKLKSQIHIYPVCMDHLFAPL